MPRIVSTAIYDPCKSQYASSNVPEHYEEKYTKISPKTIIRICLGERFRLYTGEEVNTTYEKWVGNLNKFKEKGLFTEKIRQGFLDLNLYGREPNLMDTNETGQEKPDDFYPPWYF